MTEAPEESWGGKHEECLRTMCTLFLKHQFPQSQEVGVEVVDIEEL